MLFSSVLEILYFTDFTAVKKCEDDNVMALLFSTLKKLFSIIIQDAMSVSFRSILFTSYILTIFKQRNLLP